LLFGLCLFRVHLIAAGSAMLALLCSVVASFEHWSALVSIACILGSVGALQFGYLAGLALGFAVSKPKDIAHADKMPQTTSVPSMNGNMRSQI